MTKRDHETQAGKQQIQLIAFPLTYRAGDLSSAAASVRSPWRRRSANSSGSEPRKEYRLLGPGAGDEDLQNTQRTARGGGCDSEDDRLSVTARAFSPREERRERAYNASVLRGDERADPVQQQFRTHPLPFHQYPRLWPTQPRLKSFVTESLPGVVKKTAFVLRGFGCEYKKSGTGERSTMGCDRGPEERCQSSQRALRERGSARLNLWTFFQGPGRCVTPEPGHTKGHTKGRRHERAGREGGGLPDTRLIYLSAGRTLALPDRRGDAPLCFGGAQRRVPTPPLFRIPQVLTPLVTVPSEIQMTDCRLSSHTNPGNLRRPLQLL
ncbi:hypothetical protein SKAU_G00310550 [Synaphobranchus kaupii]|uniref:Uncharacterized protein n=1 Tax=Synaphobranchus kaupii TaxID=118154 RepID=A0A9Q1ERL9_SYNKA|nr:hypothetical protein SKAU_G00310550 [Synaphobranchus kaupii]